MQISHPPPKNYKTLAFQSISSQKNKSTLLLIILWTYSKNPNVLSMLNTERSWYTCYIWHFCLLFFRRLSLNRMLLVASCLIQCSMKIIVQKEKKNNQTPQMKNVWRKETKYLFLWKINIIMNNIMNKSF